MQVISNINIDLIEPAIPPRVYAKQYDEDSRWIYATITQNGAEYEIPSGAYAVFAAAKPDGTFAIYDSNDQNDVAVFISGSVVQVQLTAAVLNVPGDVLAQISLYSANAEKLTTFSFVIAVSKSVVDDNSISEDYINVLTGLIQQAVNAENAAAESAAAAQEAASSITVPIPVTAGGTGATTVLNALKNLGMLPNVFNAPPANFVARFQFIDDVPWWQDNMTTQEFMTAMPADYTLFTECSTHLLADKPANYFQAIFAKGHSEYYHHALAWQGGVITPRLYVYNGTPDGGAWSRLLTAADFVLDGTTLKITTT